MELYVTIFCIFQSPVNVLSYLHDLKTKRHKESDLAICINILLYSRVTNNQQKPPNLRDIFQLEHKAKLSTSSAGRNVLGFFFFFFFGVGEEGLVT